MKKVLSALMLITMLSSFVITKSTEPKTTSVVIKSYFNPEPSTIFDGSLVRNYYDGWGQTLTVTVTCTGTCSYETMSNYADNYASNWPRLENGCYNPAGPQEPGN